MPSLREFLVTWLLGAAAVLLTILVVNEFFDLKKDAVEPTNENIVGPPKSESQTLVEAPPKNGIDSDQVTAASRQHREELAALHQQNRELSEQIEALHAEISDAALDTPSQITNPGASNGNPRAGSMRPDASRGEEAVIQSRIAEIQSQLSVGGTADQISAATLYAREYVSRGEFIEKEHSLLIRELKRLYGIRRLEDRQNTMLVQAIKSLNDVFVEHVIRLYKSSPDQAKLLVTRMEHALKLRQAPGPMDRENVEKLALLNLVSS